jgi:type I restriction enzyme, R subunit
VKQFIIPDIVPFVNGIPLAVMECNKGGPTCANPMHEAFEQLQRYMNRRADTYRQGLREGEPRLRVVSGLWHHHLGHGAFLPLEDPVAP